MEERHKRTALLLGEDGIQRLNHARVAVFGIGGVGGYAAEALVRAGVGALDFIDKDTVSRSNLNRQIVATEKTIGQFKAQVMQERALEINPEVLVKAHICFFLPENAAQFDFGVYDYVIDAVDTVTAKIALIMNCTQAGTPVISAMGAGNKLDPTRFEVADIYHTSVCPLAKVMRRELKKRGIDRLKVVYSKEEPVKQAGSGEEHPIPGSVSFVPAAAGLILAGEVIKDISGK